MNLDEKVLVSKYELIMILKENETLRKKNYKNKEIVTEMKEKLSKPKLFYSLLTPFL